VPDRMTPTQLHATGDTVAAQRAVLELRIAELQQIFNSMDPAPFRERDLDPKAQAYIVDWARETRAGQPLGLLVRLGGEPATTEEAGQLGDAVRAYFRQRAIASRRQLRQLFRVGRISLVIGLAFMASAVAIGEALTALVGKQGYAWVLEEGLVIGGWVALWRPMEIFLYDWWPIGAEARLMDRLSEMEVNVFTAPAPGSG